jgi:DNA-binding transcriptional MerR regulator
MRQDHHGGVPDGAYRSGAAARLAGLPVETLRVWERRYALSDPERSEHGQRLYSGAQVRRLGLIKQLVDQGHPVGALARMTVEQLRELAAPPPASAARGPVRVALVGHALARRLAAGELPALEVVRSCTNIDGAAHDLRGSSADVIIVEMSELTDDALGPIIALRQALGVALVVLYRFCANATIRQLRAHGCLVARAPSDLAEIVLLCQAALAWPHSAAPALPTVAPAPARAANAPRRLDDQALMALAAASTSLACECPRHLADILLMLTSFERYSAECASRSPSDASLHQSLNRSAGEARVLLEDALERLARADGLPLPATARNAP